MKNIIELEQLITVIEMPCNFFQVLNLNSQCFCRISSRKFSAQNYRKEQTNKPESFSNESITEYSRTPIKETPDLRESPV